MKCPIDDVDLVIAERQGIEIDYCPKCRGVWLDRGELDKLIERSTTDRSRSPDPERDSDRGRPESHRRSDDDQYRSSRRRKSLLGELFDF